MMKHLVRTIGFALAFAGATAGSALIVEIDHIDEVNAHVTHDTLVLFDIDDTLVELEGCVMGKRLWYQDMVERFQQAGLPSARFTPMCNRLWSTLFIEWPVRAVESSTASVVGDLQRRGFPVLAFTARDPCCHFDRVTRDHLLAIGVDMGRSQLAPDLLADSAGPRHHFHGGIIFSKRGPKGPALVEFLQVKEWSPERVVFVDDSLKYLKSCEESMAQAGIPFLGLHYPHAVKYGEVYDPVLAAIQLRAYMTGGKMVKQDEARWIKSRYPDRSAQDYLRPLFEWLAEDVLEVD